MTGGTGGRTRSSWTVVKRREEERPRPRPTLSVSPRPSVGPQVPHFSSGRRRTVVFLRRGACIYDVSVEGGGRGLAKF